MVFTSYCAAVLRGLRGEAVALSTYSGTGEPSRDSDSGVTNPLMPMCEGEAGADLLFNQKSLTINSPIPINGLTYIHYFYSLYSIL